MHATLSQQSLQQSYAEAQQLCVGFREVLEGLGTAFVELSGQGAAAQSVLFDLQRALSFLHSKAGHAPKPVPWLQKAPQSGSLSGGPDSGLPSAQAKNSQVPSLAANQATVGTARLTSQPSQPSATSSSSIGSGSTSRGPPAPRAGLGRPKVSAPAPVPTTRSQPSTGAGPTGLPRSTSAPGPRHRAPSPPAAPITPPPAPPPVPPKHSPHQPDPTTSSVRARDPLAPLNLPRAAAAQPATGPASACSSQGEADGPSAPPQLPGSFMRARHDYQVAVQQAQDLTSLLPVMDSGDDSGVAPGWKSTLQAAGSVFCQQLAQACQQGRVGGTGGGRVPRLQHDAQVALAALVAASTWTLQALSDCVRGQCSTDTAQDVLHMLRELPVLEDEYRRAVAAVQAAVGQGSAGEGGTRNQCVADGVQGLVLAQERTAAAVRWRNRFMRSALASTKQAPCKGAALPRVSRSPLGVWLPGPCWSHLSGPRQASAALQPRLPPWLTLLPGSVVENLRQCLSCSCEAHTYLDGNIHLPAVHPQQCRGLVKSRLQSQQHVFQLWLETLVGRCLQVHTLPHEAVQVMAGTGVRGGGRLAAGSMRGEPESRLQRVIARLRLAHMLLTKNGYNRLCCVVDTED